MTMWWIGVKRDVTVVFEATKAEAMSPDFEQQFGIAFGSYRSFEQANAGMKAHGGDLVLEAERVLASRQEQAHSEEFDSKSPPKPPEKPLRTSKPAQLTEDAVWDDRITPYSVFLKELHGLKVSIVRVLEAGKILKENIEEENERNRKKVE